MSRSSRMKSRLKVFVVFNCVVAGFILMVVYFNLLSPALPLCAKGHYSFISYLASVVFRFHRDRWVIYVCDFGKSCGELPLRLDGIMSAYMLSVLSNRKFGILFTKPVPLEQLFQPVNRSWVVDPSSLVFHSCNYYNFMVHGNFSETIQTANLDTVFPEEVVYVKLNRYHWSSLYQNPLYREKVRELGYTAPGTFHRTFVDLFEPKKDFKQKINKYSNTFKSRLATRLVCVLTDGRHGRTKEWHGLWRFLDKFKASEDTRILMTSADMDAATDGKLKYPNHFVSIPGSVSKIDEDRMGFRDRKKSSEDLEINFLDFYSLIQCDELVMMCGSDLGRVVAFSRNSNEGLHYFQNGDVRQIDLDALMMDYDDNKCVIRTNKKHLPAPVNKQKSAL